MLGHLIEHVSRQSYETFVRKHVWAACGVNDVRVAGPTISDRGKWGGREGEKSEEETRKRERGMEREKSEKAE